MNISSLLFYYSVFYCLCGSVGGGSTFEALFNAVD